MRYELLLLGWVAQAQPVPVEVATCQRLPSIPRGRPGPSRLPHPAPARPPSGDLTTVGADPGRAYAEPEDSFGQELDELDGFTAAEPGPLGAIRAAFAQGQLADSMSPGCVLAGLSEQAWQRGLASLDEDQLTGMLQAANRLAAWSAALRLAAVSQLAGRRAARAGASADQRALEHVRRDRRHAHADRLGRRPGARPGTDQ